MKALLRIFRIQIVTAVVLLSATCTRAGGLVASWGGDDLGSYYVPPGVSNIVKISAGRNHTAALRSDGTLLAWGDNSVGQTNIPPGLKNIKAISSGAYHTLALKANGTVVSWGWENYGATNVPAGLANVVDIAGGYYHSLALKADGTVVAWGLGTYGETNVPAGLSNVIAIAGGSLDSIALTADGNVVAWGDNTYGQTNVPANLSNVVAIAAGSSFNLALKGDGTVVGWGDNSSGQTNIPAGLSNVVAISAGFYHAVALKADGTVVAWGSNSQGQTNVPAALSNVTAISAGSYDSLAITPNGPVQLVQLPSSTNILWHSNATLSVTAIGASNLTYQWFFNGAPVIENPFISGSTTSALAFTNTPFSATGDYYVQVSNAFGMVRASVATVTVVGAPIIDSQSPSITARAGTNINLSVVFEGTAPLAVQWLLNGTNIPGATNSTLALVNAQPANSGVYRPIVFNPYGKTPGADIQVTITNAAPYLITVPPASVNVFVGGTVSLISKAGGSLPLAYQWRLNGFDIPGATNSTLVLTNPQSGFYNVEVTNAFGATKTSKTMVNVLQVTAWGPDSLNLPTNTPANATNLTAIAAGRYHILALKPDGTVVSWGKGQAAAPPVTNVPPSATNVMAIAASTDYSLILRSNGTLFAWGVPSALTNLPSDLTKLTNTVLAIAAGPNHALALKTNGTVVDWGVVQGVPVGLSNVVGIAAGESFSIALKNDGTLVGWGTYGTVGKTGAPPVGLSNVIAIAAGQNHALALRSDGTVVAWGSSLATNVPRGLSNVVAISGGYMLSMALKADGSVVTWGAPQLPNPDGLTNVFAIAAGGAFSVLIGNGSPVFTLQPASPGLITNGSVVYLNARAVGKQPLTYKWQLNGTNIPNATNGSLVITNVQGRDNGIYRLIAGNALGSITSSPAIITTPFSPNLTASLNSQLIWATSPSPAAWFAENKTTHDGVTAAQSGAITHNQSTYVQTSVAGPGKLSFWWKVSSEEGFDFLKFSMSNLAGTSADSISGEVDWQMKTYIIPSGNYQVTWTYTKDANVSAGQDAGWLDQVTYTPDPPSITRQPISAEVNLDEAVVFDVAATGVPTLTYQWAKNGTNLTNFTSNSLTLPHVTRNDAGVYTVTVSNPGGSTLSSNAVLVVDVPPQLNSPQLQKDGTLLISSSDADPMQPADLAHFQVQTSTNLRDWINLTNIPTCTNGSLKVIDTNATNGPAHFYRIIKH